MLSPAENGRAGHSHDKISKIDILPALKREDSCERDAASYRVE